MADMIFGSGTGAWVCPNDRQLALRAKLQTGWSVHTFQSEKQRKMQALSPKELEVILGVIRKAEKLDAVEQQRIGRLVERLENMRKNAMGNGLSQCLLCGETLGLLGSSSVFCQDCKKKVCTKCGIETVGAQKRPLWLCKICSEQREVWKRSGAWFYRGLPKYIRPLKSSSSSSKPLELQPQPWQGEAAAPEPESVGSSRSFTWARGKVVSSDSESDSELSSSSLEDKPVPVGSKGSAGGKLPAGMAPTRGPGQARSRALGTPQSPRLSGSHSSLGSEQESGQSDQAWDRRHSDAATGTPAAAEWGCQKVTLCGSSGRLCTFRTPRQEQFWLHIITSGLEFLLLLKRFLEVPALM
ncbi:rab effector Noc2 isoform X3 [Hirundo rustica]|nr:rab effector Noc2 isoform X3 [Hirundo rustica]XP_039938354.1 rab effector Noc2 isoform X3 [Hirundo rustica]XP_039938355.1 rab effector Noc2 isoform X3 [Hirundo rustica]